MKPSTLHDLEEFRPEWGVVLGSGLGALDPEFRIAGQLPFAAAPELPQPRVPGHPGELAWGTLGGARVVVAGGRVHLYEGATAAEVTAGVRLLSRAGVRRLLLTNAAGSLNEAHPPGAWMAITDHLNLTGKSPLRGTAHFVPMNDAYSPALRAHFARAAAACGLPLLMGVYAGVPGPQYETPAEVRMLRALGADAVGMSTVLETIQARALGLEVAGFSCLTNWAAGLSGEPLRHEDVLAAGRTAAAGWWELLRQALQTPIGVPA